MKPSSKTCISAWRLGVKRVRAEVTEKLPNVGCNTELESSVLIDLDRYLRAFLGRDGRW